MERFLGSKTRQNIRFSTFLTGMVMMLVGGMASAQTTYYSRASTGWNTAGTWSTISLGGPSCACIPAAANDVINIGGGFAVTLTGAAALVGTLNINDGSSLSVGGTSLTVSGTTTIGNGTSGSISFITNNNGAKVFGPVIINNGATWTNNVNEGFTFNGGLTNNNASVININAPAATAGTSLFGLSQGLSGNFAFFNLTVATGATLTNANTITVTNNLTVNAGTTFLNNGTVNSVAALVGGGTFTQGAGATLNLANTFTVTTLNATASNNTVNYTGSGQVARNMGYFSLGFTGTGIANIPATVSSIPGNFTVGTTVTLVASTGLSVGGNVTVSGSFNAGAFTHSLSGNFTNTGTFLSMGLINLDGANQVIDGVTTSFGALTLSGTGIKTFNVQTSISGNLQISNGVSVDFNGLTTHSANRLFLSGYIQPAGIWGTIASGAINTNDTFFTGTGTINVVSGNYTYFSRASNDWNNPITWSTVGHASAVNAGTYPQAGDYAIMGGGNTVTITGAETCDVLLYDAGTSVTNVLQISGSNSLAVSNAITIPQMATSGSNIFNVGSGSLTAASLSFTSTTGGVAHQLSIGTGSVTITGNISGVNPTSTITFSNAGLLRIGGSLFSSATGTLTTFAGSTVEYNGSGAQTVQAHGYQNLTVGGGNTKTLAADMTINGNLLVSNGTTLVIGGLNTTVTGTTTINGTLSVTAAGGTKIFGGLITISNTGTWSALTEGFTIRNGITNNGTFSAGTGVYLFNTNAQQLNGNFVMEDITVTGVTLTNNNSLTSTLTLSGNGTLLQAANASLTIGAASAITNLTATAVGNTVEYNGAGPQTIHTGNYYNLTLSGGSVKTLLVGTPVIANNLTISGSGTATTSVVNTSIGGSLDVGVGSTFNGSTFTLSITGNVINNGTLTSSGLINLAGAAQSINGSATTFNNLTFSGTGVKTIIVPLTISATLTINTGVVADLGVALEHTANQLILGGAIQPAGQWGHSSSASPFTNDIFFANNTGYIILTNGGFTYYSRDNGAWNDVNTWSNTGHAGLAASQVPGPSDFVVIGGGFTVTVAGVETCANLSFSSVTGSILDISGANALTVTGSITIPRPASGSNSLSVGSGALTATSLSFTASGSGGHSLVIGSGTATINGNINGIGSSSTITLSGTGLLRVSGSLFAGGTFTAVSGGEVEFNGGAQAIPVYNYQDLTVSNGNTKTFSGATTIAGNLNVATGTTLAMGGFNFTTTGTTTIDGTLSITSATGTKVFVGLITVNAAGTWNAITESFSMGGGITNNGTFNAGSGNYQFSTNSQTLTGNFTMNSVTVTNAGVTLTNAGTLTVTGASGTLTVTGTTVFVLNNGTISVASALSGTGNITQGTNAVLNIGGTSGITGLNATANGNIVNYTGAAQTIHTGNYHHLNLAGSGVKALLLGTTSIAGNFTLAGTASVTAVTGLTVGASFDVGLGTTFNGSTFTHSIGGNLINNGTFTSSGLVDLNGAAQSISGNSIAFNNLTASGSGTKLFSVSTTIAANFTISNGVLVDFGTITSHTTNTLIFGVVAQAPGGTWGTLASGAANPNDVFFVNTGYVTVTLGTFTYFSRASGSWNDSNTWSTVDHTNSFNAGTYPTAADIAIIGGGFTVSVNTNESASQIQFNPGTAENNALNISSGNSLTVSGAITIPRNVTSGSNILNVGDGLLNAGSLSFSRTSGGSHQMTIGTGTASFIGSIAGSGVSSTVSFSGAGTLRVGDTFFSATAGTLSAGLAGTVEFNSAAAQIIPVHAYRNVTVSGGNTKSFANTITLSGNLQVGAATTLSIPGISVTVNGTTTVNGTLLFGTSAAGTKTFGGLITVNPGGTWNNAINEGFTINGLTGGITNNGTFIAGTGTYLTNAGSPQLTGNFTLANVTVNGVGVTLTNNNTLTVTGTLGGSGGLVQNAGATLNLNNLSTIATLNATALNNTVSFAGAAQTVHPSNYYNLTLSGSGIKTLQAGTTTINGNFTLSGTATTSSVVGLSIAGGLNIGGGSIFTNNSTVTVSGVLTGLGTFVQGVNAVLNLVGTPTLSTLTAVANGNTVNYGGANQTVYSGNYHHLTLAGSGIKTLQTGTTTIGGDFSLQGTSSTTAVTGLTIGNTFSIGANASFFGDSFTHNVAGNFSQNGSFSSSGTINLNGTAQLLSGNDTGFTDLILAGSGTKTFAFTATLSGTFSINSGVVANLGNTLTHSASVLVLGGVTQTVGGPWGSSSSTAVNVNNTYFSNTGIITITSGNFTYFSRTTGDWSAPSTWSTVGHGSTINSGTYPQAGDNAVIGGGFTISVNSAETTNNISFQPGTSVTNTLTINGTNSLAVIGSITIPQTATSGSNILNVAAGSLTSPSLAFTSTVGGAGHQLTIGSGTVSISGNVTGIGVSSTIDITGAGTLQIGGLFFTAGNGTLTTATGSTVAFTGSAAQAIENATTFHNLTINSGTSVSLSAAILVNGTLYLQGGSLVNSSNLLTMGNGGTVRRNVGSGSLTGSAPISGTPPLGNSYNLIYEGGAGSTGVEAQGSHVKDVTVSCTLTQTTALNLYGRMSIEATGNYDPGVNLLTVKSWNDLGPDAGGSIAQIFGTFQNNPVFVERYFRIRDNVDRFIASPVDTASVAQLQTAFPVTGSFGGTSFPCTGCNNNGASLRWYRESVAGTLNNGYQGYPTTNKWARLKPGVGYDAWMWNGVSPTTVVFNGLINKNSVDDLGTNSSPLQSLSRTVTGFPGSDGWNLIGNPYPSPIRWNGTSGGGWTMTTNIAPAAYAWDVVNSVWVTLNAGSDIAIGQAFWVQVTSGTSGDIDITEAAKSPARSGSYYRERSERPMITVSLSRNDVRETAFITWNNKATANFQSEIDFSKIELGIESMHLSLVKEENNLGFYSMNEDWVADIPVRIKAESEGIYELGFEATGGFVGLSDYSLLDVVTGNRVAFIPGMKIPFVHSRNHPEQRFILTRKTDLPVFAQDLVQAYPNPTTGNLSIVASPKEIIRNIVVLNSSGQPVNVNSIQRGGITELSLSDSPGGVYLIKVTLDAGVVVKRIVKY